MGDEKKPKRMLPFKAEQRVPQHVEKSVVTIELSDDEELPSKRLKLPAETISLDVSGSDDSSAESCDWTEVRCRCEAEEVPEKFLTLVALCSPASEVEVLSQLLYVSGDVKATISYFGSKRPRNYT